MEPKIQQEITNETFDESFVDAGDTVMITDDWYGILESGGGGEMEEFDDKSLLFQWIRIC